MGDPFNPLASVIVFQHNPDTLTRTLQARTAGSDNAATGEVLRLTGPPQESIKCARDAPYGFLWRTRQPQDFSSGCVVAALVRACRVRVKRVGVVLEHDHARQWIERIHRNYGTLKQAREPGNVVIDKPSLQGCSYKSLGQLRISIRVVEGLPTHQCFDLLRLLIFVSGVVSPEFYLSNSVKRRTGAFVD